MITKTITEEVKVIDEKKNINHTTHLTEYKLWGMVMYRYIYNLKSNMKDGEEDHGTIGFKK